MPISSHSLYSQAKKAVPYENQYIVRPQTIIFTMRASISSMSQCVLKQQEYRRESDEKKSARQIER
jgi:hypothetical protein